MYNSGTKGMIYQNKITGHLIIIEVIIKKTNGLKKIKSNIYIFVSYLYASIRVKS